MDEMGCMGGAPKGRVEAVLRGPPRPQPAKEQCSLQPQSCAPTRHGSSLAHHQHGDLIQQNSLL